MFQSRTHTCNELRIGHVGQQVTLAGWYENMRRVSKNLGFLILRDFYGETQVVIESEEMMEMISGVNRESTLSVTGTVRERSSKNAALPILAATMLHGGVYTIHRCPDIADVALAGEIIETLGGRVERRGGSLVVDTREARGRWKTGASENSNGRSS